MAHRFVYEMITGETLKGGWGHPLHHVCENRTCVNPDHMMKVTMAEHKQEHSHLTVKDIRKIRDLRGYIEQREIGKMFGIHPNHVLLIQKGISWGNA